MVDAVKKWKYLPGQWESGAAGLRPPTDHRDAVLITMVGVS